MKLESETTHIGAQQCHFESMFYHFLFCGVFGGEAVFLMLFIAQGLQLASSIWSDINLLSPERHSNITRVGNNLQLSLVMVLRIDIELVGQPTHLMVVNKHKFKTSPQTSRHQPSLLFTSLTILISLTFIS